MSSRPRMVETPLYTFGAWPPTTKVIEIALAKPATTTPAALLVFPEDFYPLHDHNQIILKWYLKTLPTAATAVTITPVTWEFMNYNSTLSPTGNPGFLSGAGLLLPYIAKHQFDFLDSTNGYVTINPYKIRKTAADSTLLLNGTYQLGTRHAIPIAEGFMGFLIEHDGTQSTGVHSMFATVTWA